MKDFIKPKQNKIKKQKLNVHFKIKIRHTTLCIGYIGCVILF